MNISGYVSLGNATTEATALDEGTVSADFVKAKGNHTFTFGYMGILSMVLGGAPAHTTFGFTPAFSAGPNPSNPTTGTGNAFASFLMGAAATGGGHQPAQIFANIPRSANITSGGICRMTGRRRKI